MKIEVVNVAVCRKRARLCKLLFFTGEMKKKIKKDIKKTGTDGVESEEKKILKITSFEILAAGNL